MSITTIYHVSHTLPDELADYLATNDTENKRFESHVTIAIKGHVAAGSNTYSSREEWAEFDTLEEAKQADTQIQNYIDAWHVRSMRKLGGE